MQDPKVFRREELLTVPQFAAHVGMSRRWVYEQCEKGRAGGGIFSFRFGAVSGIRIPRTELVRLLAERRVEPGA